MKKNSFTLIELLLVVSIIGILSGIVLNIINVKKQRAIATDSVSRAHLEKVSQGLEAFYLVKSIYPASLDADGVSDFVQNLPEGLVYYVSADGSQMAVEIVMQAQDNSYLKYMSVYGEIKECGSGGGYTTCNEVGGPLPQ